MREILFRGKRADNGEWIYGDLLHDHYIYGGGEITQIYNHKSRLTHRENIVISETVGQYIGVSDKNSTMIFEGDVIQTKRITRNGEKTYKFVIKYGVYIPVEYCRTEYCKYNTIGFYALDGNNRFYQLGDYGHLYEVIGNIHDNPELLEV